MIENYLIQNGFGCGSVKNFANEVAERTKFAKDERWYFSTPIKTNVSGGLAECTIHLAYPFLAQKVAVAFLLAQNMLSRACLSLPYTASYLN